MNVNLHIDSIVLEGIDLRPGDDRLIQQILSRELTTLVSTDGLGSSHRTSRDSISGGSIHLGSSGAESVGHQLAQSIHRGMVSTNGPSAAAAEGDQQ